MSNSNTANSLAVRVVGRVPAWYEVDPARYVEGRIKVGEGQTFEALKSPRAHLRAQIRRSQKFRSGLLRIVGDPDTAATYDVTVNGVTASFDASVGPAQNASQIYEGIFGALGFGAGGTPPADFDAELTQSGTDQNGTPVYDGILLFGKVVTVGTFAELTIDAVAVTGGTGTGVLGAFVEPDAAAFELWGTSSRGTNADAPFAEQWFRIWPRYATAFESVSLGGGIGPEPGGGGGTVISPNDSIGYVGVDGVVEYLDVSAFDLLEVVIPVGDDPGSDALDTPAGNAAEVRPLIWIYVGPTQNEDSNA